MSNNYTAQYCIYSVQGVDALVDDVGQLKPFQPVFSNYYALGDPQTIQDYLSGQPDPPDLPTKPLNCVMIVKKGSIKRGARTKATCLWADESNPDIDTIKKDIMEFHYKEDLIVLSTWNGLPFNNSLEPTIEFAMEAFCFTKGMGKKWVDKSMCCYDHHEFLYIRDAVNNA